MTTTTTHTVKTLEARRAHGQALIEAADAEQAQRLAAAEAQAAQQEVARRQSQARLAEFRAQFDQIDTFVEEQRQREHAAIRARLDHHDELRRQIEELGNWKPPHVRRSPEEHRAELAQLGDYVDRQAQAERDRDVAYIDRCESQRLWDRPFAARWAESHPGGLDGCTCPAHRAYRGNAHVARQATGDRREE